MSASSAPGQSKSSPKSHATPIVFVVDDDISVREAPEKMIRSEGWQPETFESAQEFLAHPRALVPSCLVLDVSLPGLNGLELQKRVAVERTDMPIIFITGYGDVYDGAGHEGGRCGIFDQAIRRQRVAERHPACP